LLAQDLLASAQSVFGDLVEFVKSLQEVIYCFTKSNLLRAQLKQLQAAQNLKMLVRHCPTRWCSMQRCGESLLDSDGVLNAIVAKREFVNSDNRARVKEIVQGVKFVDYLRKVIAILAPIDRLVVKYQKDAVPISEIIPDLAALTAQYKNLASEKTLSKAECTFVEEAITAREKFFVSTPHFLAHLLDPRFFGDLLPPMSAKTQKRK
jgi:hypothetical protein